MEQPASAAPQRQPAQLCQIGGLALHVPKHNFFQAELQDQSWCLSKTGYSQDGICTFTALDYNLTCFGEVTPFPELGPVCQHVIPLCKQMPLAQESFTQVSCLGFHNQ